MKFKSKSVLISFFTALVLLGFLPAFVLAQPNFQGSGGFQSTPTTSTEIVNPETGGLVVCGNGNQQSGGCTLYDLFSIFARVINFLLAVAGFFAIFQIVRAGQSMVLAFGNPENLTTAKASLTNAILGFALVMAAYLLMYFVVYQFLGIKKPEVNLFFHPIQYLQGVGGGSTTTPPPGPVNPPPGSSKINTQLVSEVPPPEEPCDTGQSTDPKFPWLKTAHACVEPGDDPPLQANCDTDKQDSPYFSLRGTGLYFKVTGGHDDAMKADLVLAVRKGSTIIMEEHYPYGQASIRIDLPPLANGTYTYTLQEVMGGPVTTIATLTVDSTKTLADCPGAGGGGGGTGTNTPPSGEGSYPPSGRCLAESSSDRGPRDAVCTPPEQFNPPLVDMTQYVSGIEVKSPGAFPYVHPGSISLIQQIVNNLSGGPQLRVTEAYPPWSYHSSVCHFNGRCIDVSPFANAPSDKPRAIREFNSYCRAIKEAGITNFLNETGLTETKSECGKLITTTFGKGAHIHIRLYK